MIKVAGLGVKWKGGNPRNCCHVYEKQLASAQEFFIEVAEMFPCNILTGTSLFAFTGSRHVVIHLAFSYSSPEYVNYLNKLLERCGCKHVWNFDFLRADMKFIEKIDMVFPASEP